MKKSSNELNAIRSDFQRLLKQRAQLSFKTKRIGLEISDVVEESQKANAGVRIRDLDKHLIFFDEMISIYVSLNFLLQLLLHKFLEDKFVEGLAFIRSCFAVSCRIVSDSMGIRLLVQNGFDVQAKAMLRSLDECCELLAAFLIKPELTVEFFESQQLEYSRKFWYQHVNKGKLRRIIDENIRSMNLPESLLSEMAAYRAEERLISLTAKHVSFVSGYMAYVAEENRKSTRPGLFGQKNKNSVRTIIYAINVMIEPLALSPNFPFKLLEKYETKMRTRPEREMMGHIKHGLATVMELIARYKIFSQFNSRQPTRKKHE